MCTKRIVGWLLFSLFFVSGWANAEMRTWTKKDGTTLQAEFVREVLGTLVLKDAAERKISIRLNNLSVSDLRYYQNTIPPKINIDFFKNIKKKKRNRFAVSFIRDEMFVLNGTLTLTKESKRPFGGTLRGELYLVGQEVATDDYRMLLKKKFPLRFTAENKGICSLSVVTEIRQFIVALTKQSRGVTYSGYMVVIADEKGKVLQTKTDLGWLDEESLSFFRELPAGSFFNDLGFRVKVPRPPYYSKDRGYSK